MLAYHLSLPHFFKPSVETFAVKNVFVNTLAPEAQTYTSDNKQHHSVLHFKNCSIYYVNVVCVSYKHFILLSQMQVALCEHKITKCHLAIKMRLKMR